jgi:hypothetical protein
MPKKWPKKGVLKSGKKEPLKWFKGGSLESFKLAKDSKKRGLQSEKEEPQE